MTKKNAVIMVVCGFGGDAFLTHEGFLGAKAHAIACTCKVFLQDATLSSLSQTLQDRLAVVVSIPFGDTSVSFHDRYYI